MKLVYVISTQPTKFQAVAFDPNFEGNAKHLAKLGYAGIELAVREPDKLDVANVQRILEQHHLTVPAFGTGQAYVEEHLSFTDPDAEVREQAIARVETHIALATKFDNGSVIASRPEQSEGTAKQSLNRDLEIASAQKARLAMTEHPLVILGLIRGIVQPGVSTEQAHTWLVNALKHLARTADAQSVRLAIEPLNRYETNLLNTVSETLALIAETGADNLGVLFDTFHANIEEPQIGESLRACGDRLLHVHFADSNRWYPGAGHIDFGHVIKVLADMKYAGWVSAEILPKPDVKTASERTMQTIIRIK